MVQGRGNPRDVTEQVTFMFAVLEGYTNDISVEEIPFFEEILYNLVNKSFYSYIFSYHLKYTLLKDSLFYLLETMRNQNRSTRL